MVLNIPHDRYQVGEFHRLKHPAYFPIHDLHDRSHNFYGNSKLGSDNIHGPNLNWAHFWD